MPIFYWLRRLELIVENPERLKVKMKNAENSRECDGWRHRFLGQQRIFSGSKRIFNTRFVRWAYHFLTSFCNFALCKTDNVKKGKLYGIFSSEEKCAHLIMVKAEDRRVFVPHHCVCTSGKPLQSECAGTFRLICPQSHVWSVLLGKHINNNINHNTKEL